MNIAIFISGNGSNCENIIQYFAMDPQIHVALVLCNRKEALGLEKARALGVKTCVINKEILISSQKLLPLLDNIDLIVLAGFLPMIPNFLIKKFYQRIINLHPALLPKYGGKGMYGKNVHKAVKEAEEKETGMTVHFVSNICDGGEIIAQFSIPIDPTDSIETIAHKEHQLELKHFPKVIEKIAQAIIFQKKSSK